MPKNGTKNALFGYFWNRTLEKMLSNFKLTPSKFSDSEFFQQN